MMLIVLGPRIPHSEKIEKAEGWAFLLLLLYKPWRDITQLKQDNETWVGALSRFEEECHKQIMPCYLTIVELQGDSERLQYILNTDTLSKSQQDAEDESKARAETQEATQTSHCSSSCKEWRHQPKAMMNASIQQQDEEISVQDFLTFNIPYIESAKQLSYIAGAIGAGQHNFVLPSYYGCVSCFESPVAGREESE